MSKRFTITLKHGRAATVSHKFNHTQTYSEATIQLFQLSH